MVSSTDIPNAILNTKMVDGLIGTPKKPIIPAVNNNGKRLGISDITTIRQELNISAIKKDIRTIAKLRLRYKLFTRY